MFLSFSLSSCHATFLSWTHVCCRHTRREQAQVGSAVIMPSTSVKRQKVVHWCSRRRSCVVTAEAWNAPFPGVVAARERLGLGPEPSAS